jgi:hypothetical protein
LILQRGRDPRAAPVDLVEVFLVEEVGVHPAGAPSQRLEPWLEGAPAVVFDVIWVIS